MLLDRTFIKRVLACNRKKPVIRPLPFARVPFETVIKKSQAGRKKPGEPARSFLRRPKEYEGLRATVTQWTSVTDDV